MADRQLIHSVKSRVIFIFSCFSLLLSLFLDLINNPQLNALVEATLIANNDLRQTALRLQEQYLLTNQAEGRRLPGLDLGLASQREKNPHINNRHNLSLNLSWELDVWGRLSDLNASAQATTDSVAMDYQAARDSLAGKTVQLWLEYVGLTEIIAVEKQWLINLERAKTIVAERYRKEGTTRIALADLETARTETALIRARLASTRQQQRDVIRQLSGLQGQAVVISLITPEKLPMVANPPALLPANVIADRPDIQAALHRINAADADARATHKQLLPDFTLSASLSQNRPELGDLLSGSAAWNLLGELSAPLFKGGQLRADVEIAELKLEQQYLAYQQVVVDALNEVETRLGQEAALAEQERQLSLALKHSQASLVHYQHRYRDGLSDLLDMLTSQQNVFDIQIQYLNLRQTRLINRVEFGLAMGMGA